VKHLSLSSDPEVNGRISKRIQEYLSNISEVINPSLPWDQNKPALRPKLKNLPQRYHVYVERVAEAYCRGVWNTSGRSLPVS
jgi:hypothetical protein